MPAGPVAGSLSGTGVPLQVSVVADADVNDAVFVTKPPLPSGSFQRIGTNVPRGTRFGVGAGIRFGRKPSKLNVLATLKPCVTAVVKFTASFAVTLKVRAPAVRVFTIAPSGFGAVQESSEMSVHE